MLSLSDGGEDAVTAREFDRAAARFVPGGFVLPHGKQSLAWQDEGTLLVAREWQAGELTASGYPFVVKRLRRGQPLDAAEEVFRGQASDVGVEPLVLEDAAGHRAVLIQRNVSFFEVENYLVVKGKAARLALPAKVDIVGLLRGRLLVELKQAWQVGAATFPQGALVALDLAASARQPGHLRPVLVYAPGPRETFDRAATTRDALVVATLENVRGRVSLMRPQPGGGWSSRTLALPDNASISIVDADERGSTAYLRVAGFLKPPGIWQLDTRRGAAEQVKTAPPKFDAANLQVRQFEAASSDGTKIPYFVVGPRDMKEDGSQPTIINAYGGFQASMKPFYGATLGKLWLERGGVFVLANIRGGGEFGPAWHEAGLKTRRQLVFDDFTAVAHDLIARKITTPRRLGIEGGSNGGLLMGAQFTQHPELWSAVDIQVPLLDMLRYEQIAAGPSWVAEYGTVADPAERAFLASISPYANLRRGVAYPRPLVWTTTKDDRVGPQHARKFAARLAEYGVPYYFYEVTEGGHGAGANLRQTAHTSALEMTYFARQLMPD
jgi:prolyl oligopeptidase